MGQPQPFAGFGPDAFTFLETLAERQDRDWFEANKARYDAEVRGPVTALVGDLNIALAQREVTLRGDPQRSVFRIHRDVRFGKDKRPYKTHVGAVLTRDGEKDTPGLLYIHIDPAGCFVAAGFYHCEPDVLFALRTAAAKPAALGAVADGLAAADLAMEADGDALKRLPRGFVAEPGTALDAFLRRRNHIVRRSLSRAEIAEAGLVAHIADFAMGAVPLLAFGWRAIDGRAHG